MPTSIAIWGLILLAAILVVVVLRQRAGHRRRLGQQRREFEQRIRSLQEEQTAQIRRLRRERDRIEETGHLGLVEELVDALDDLDKAIEHADNPEQFRSGVEMTHKKILSTLEAHGVEPIEPAPADAFDPKRHEALRAVDPDDAEPGTVVHLHRRGYRFEERVIRPAAVDVAVGRETDSAPADTPEREHTEEQPDEKQHKA